MKIMGNIDDSPKGWLCRRGGIFVFKEALRTVSIFEATPDFLRNQFFCFVIIPVNNRQSRTINL